MDKVSIDSYEKKNPVFACDGCSHAYGWTAVGWKCPCFECKEVTYSIRVYGVCPLNQKEGKVASGKVRVGQQKNKKRR